MTSAWRIAIALAVVVLVTAAQPVCVFACSCRPPGAPGEALAGATTVFAGQVTAIAAPSNRGGSDPVEADHVSIVIHNYRWRLGLAHGDPRYDELEQRLAQAPVIGVPTITLEGDANGAPHPDATTYAKKFGGQYAHRVISGGIGHNVPQEAPHAFAQAVVDVHEYASTCSP